MWEGESICRGDELVFGITHEVDGLGISLLQVTVAKNLEIHYKRSRLVAHFLGFQYHLLLLTVLPFCCIH